MEGVTALGPTVGTPRAALCAFVTDTVHPSDLGHSSMWRGWRYGRVITAVNHYIVRWGTVIQPGQVYTFTIQKKDVDDFIRVLEDTLTFFRSLDWMMQHSCQYSNLLQVMSTLLSCLCCMCRSHGGYKNVKRNSLNNFSLYLPSIE